jgi:hypothetical protein
LYDVGSQEFSESRTLAQRISLASAGINQVTLDASNGQYDAVVSPTRQCNA